MIDQVLMDIDQAPNEAAPRKRIKPQLRERILRNAAQKPGAKLDQVIAIMCSPVGWAGKVSESKLFRIKINTIWSAIISGFLLIRRRNNMNGSSPLL